MFGKFSKNYSKSDFIIINERTVSKRLETSDARLEAKKTSLAHKLSLKSGLFYVPKVFGFDRWTNTIEFERIDDYCTFGQIMAGDHDENELIYKAGNALGFIHTNFHLPDDLKRSCGSDNELNTDDCVYLHGDFNTINVGFSKDMNSIVILDWASAPVIGSSVTVGPRYLDIASFLRSLVMHQANFKSSLVHFCQRANTFLNGYEDQTRERLNRLHLGDYLLKVSRLHLNRIFETHSLIKAGYWAGVELIAQKNFKKQINNWSQPNPDSTGMAA